MVVIESAISAQNMSTSVFNCFNEQAINLSSVSSSKAIMPALIEKKIKLKLLEYKIKDLAIKNNIDLNKKINFKYGKKNGKIQRITWKNKDNLFKKESQICIF